MNILSVSYPFAPVGTGAVGGAEQILSLLDQAWTEKGHQSVVLACPGSQCSGLLCTGPSVPEPLTVEARTIAQQKVKERLWSAIAAHRPALVHMHGIDFFNYLPPEPMPLVITLHLPVAWYPSWLWSWRRPNTAFVCVSESQRATLGQVACAVRCIPNGIAVNRFRFRDRKFNYVCALGRICPEKGFDVAFRAADKARCALYLAGSVYAYPEHQGYFSKTLCPMICPPHRYLGPIGFERKRRLLAGAKALVVPSQVEETSSLVAMEALASGTPVIAFRRGALREIVEHGRTGFLVDNEQEMALAIEKAGTIAPSECRRAALERFRLEPMSAQYEMLYQQLVVS